MVSLLKCEVTSLLWYISKLKNVYEQGGRKAVKCFRNFGADTEEYEIFCHEKLEDLPECTYHEFLYEEYEDSDEQGDIDGEKWVFESKEMCEYYRLLEDLKKRKLIEDKEYGFFHKEMTDYILHVLVYKQYNDGGFHCHLDDGTMTDGYCHIEIYHYLDGSFGAFDAVCGIIAIFERYSERLKFLEDKYTVKYETEVKNGA